MKEQLIEFKTAKLAKEKGFELNLASYNYSEENKFNIGLNVCTLQDLENFKIYPAPTQSLLQKWIREEYNIIVVVDKVDSTLDSGFYYNIYSILVEDNYEILEFKTYEEALEKGLFEALKLIK